MPENPPTEPGEGCLGRLGMESFLEPQLFTHAVRVKVDRETGVVRVLQVAAAHDSGTIVNRIGADGQVYGGVVMGIGLALSERTQFDADGRQRNPHLLDYKLATASDVPRIDVDWVENPAENGGPQRLQGGRRAAERADGGRDRKRDREGHRSARPRAADDSRARLGRPATVTQSYHAAETVEDALAALASGARPVAGGTDLVVGARQGKAPLPDSIVAIHRLAELRGVELDGDALRLGALTTHEEIAEHALVLERLTALADAAAIVGSHATRAQGTVGGNLMNASPAMEVGGPLMCFGATVTLQSQGGKRSVAVADLFAGPGRTTARAGRAPHRGGDAASSRGDRELLRPPRVQAADGDRGRRRHRGRDVRGDRVGAAKVAITALAPTVRLVPAAEEALVGSDGGRAAAEPAAQAAAEASEPISDVRASEDYRRAMAAVLARRAIEAAVARARGVSIAVPASRFLHAAG